MKTRTLLSLTLVSAALGLLALLGNEDAAASALGVATVLLCLITWFSLYFVTRKKNQSVVLQQTLVQEFEKQKQALESQTAGEQAKRLQFAAELQASVEREKLQKIEAQTLKEELETKEAELQALRSQRHAVQSQEGRDAGDTAVLQFLRSLQERGRLLDFAMADINRLPDAQVGAAARVVHQGVKVVLQDYFDIQPISSAEEGSLVALPHGDAGDSQKFRILSRDGAESSSSEGRLLHRGWEALNIRLPQSMPRAAASARIIAPAEIDVQR